VYIALGTVAVVIAAVAGWFLAGNSAKSEAEQGAVGTATAAPATSGLPEVPAATGASGQPLPAATDVPVRPPITGTGPAASATPGGPTQTSPSTAASESPDGTDSPDVSSPPDGKRLASQGGVVYAKCAQGKATLTAWEPESGYSVEKVQPGPSLASVIVFKNAQSRYRTTVTCVAGTPTPVVLPL
jgi:serine/threonine-protein kinase